MLMHTSLALQDPDSRDWSIRPRNNRGEPFGRRQAVRYLIKLPVRYQAGGESGWGETVNISSRGALFTVDRTFVSGASVEVYIKWPVLFHNSIQLGLIAAGTIIRVEPGRAALAIEKYEFRTCISSFFQPSQPRQHLGRVAPAQKSPSESQMAHLQVPYQETPGAGECTLPQRPLGRRADIAHDISKNTPQRSVDVSNARWERIFQEKFADPEYYSSRWLPHSSPRVGP